MRQRSIKMTRHDCMSGFTLIELVVTVAVLAILSTYGVSQFSKIQDKRQLKGVVSMIHQDLRYARGQALKMNKKVVISATAGSSWCYGLTTKASCDCGTPNDCTITTDAGTSEFIRAASMYPDVTLSSATSLSFSPFRGTVANGNITMVSGDGVSAKVVVLGFGRARVCSDDATATGSYGFESC